jgi:outer membrane protein
MKNKLGIIVILVILTNSIFAQTEKRVIALDTVFSLLEKNNTQLKISGTLKTMSQENVSIIQGSRLPDVKIQMSALYNGDGKLLDRDFSNVQTAPIPLFGNNFSIEASYLIFSGNALNNSAKNANLEVQLAQLAYQQNLTDMRFLVAGYYLELYRLNNQRKVFLKNIDQTQVLINQVIARQKDGMALNNDLTRYELMLQNLKMSLLETDNSLKIVNQQLSIAIGLPVDLIIEPDSSVQNLKVNDISDSNVNEVAFKNRTSLKMAGINAQIAENKVKLTQSKYYPSVALIAADLFNGPILIEVPPINKNLNYWYVGVGLTYNMESLYKTKREVRIARSNYELAQYTQNLEKERTYSAVLVAQTQFQESIEKLKEYEKTYQLASENYSVINNRYTNGLVLITEMLDASTSKLNAELQVVNGKLNIVYNHFKLLRELGTL